MHDLNKIIHVFLSVVLRFGRTASSNFFAKARKNGDSTRAVPAEVAAYTFYRKL